jgi:hypothetical protein
MATVKKVKKAQFGAPIKKGGYRGGCAATTSGADRAERREGRQAERDYKKAVRVAGREERQAERAEKKAAKSAPAKYGKSVKKAQSGKMVPSEMKPGKMIKKADRDARATKMADALDKQARKGSSDRPMGANLDKKSFDKVPSLDKLKKKIEKKKSGGKAKMGKSMGKCKYGC